MKAKKKANHIKRLLTWIALPSLILNLYFGYQLTKPNNNLYKMLAVLDGDTLVLENKARLRLRNIDAPELENCGGKEAKEYLQDLLKRNQGINISERIIDQRGRPMAYVYSDQTFLNLEMLKSGWARYHHDNSAKKDVLKQAADEAKTKNIGLYKKCVHQEPANPRCVIKGNIDNNSPYTKRYYYPGCAQYQFVIVEEDQGEDWFCTEKQAQKAGYNKAKSCP
ncbi:hypothetical protein A2313_02185 [Candidatus Roizmanbacteria bacterium RIFOXYB2_FULL_41_10]|uniref:TNase-like domain-containing protein n=1 Tax=Candidatus Roizmanbacteria bacterium RIFOXYA1_FULL_41_12 TaxID=1802082 RepID=A0A1F7KF37_9BACT|nr:MAG: hypothetical protein A2262_02065 [Candidatus Roizmanbacteria bacterium RIFOXYA2_FULL_41_8]OGK66461.1 MAG: hypothetical protein A2209_01775 [Candidatus Roizmanbacteria bacterium RIFOXYA1_FULL_41_12]OGK67353.1 MAG: hypothetical protein A2377_04365 [Candidatus Roizmanbacteria bacterium RIFOXYB1_FULL_41_27]OGK69272.1 MAG: hypothetical protein A2313_02185 [Candidatus Roizmanbacteria bacterium RIFOXYB2_FULL_41_10]OGK71965.1 MAG: hypothetical protein A2403_03355 [Candidatus Roizmanbacteria bac